MMEGERRKHAAVETKCVRSMCVAVRMDRVINEEMRHRAGVEETMSNRVDRKILNELGYV